MSKKISEKLEEIIKFSYEDFKNPTTKMSSIYTKVWSGQRLGSTNSWVDIKQDAKAGIRTCQKEPESYHIKSVN